MGLAVSVLSRPLQLNFVGALGCAALMEISAQRLPALGLKLGALRGVAASQTTKDACE